MTPKESLDWVENIFEEHHVQLPDVELTLIRQALTELEELKRDVKRFIELLMKDNHTGRDTFDIEILKDKLMKVDDEE